MNINTVKKFLEDRGFLWHSTGESLIDGELSYLTYYLTKERVADIDISSGEHGDIDFITITPQKNVFYWAPRSFDYNTCDENIYLQAEHLYKLEYILDLIENDVLWEAHVKEYEKLYALFKKITKEYKQLLTPKEYKHYFENNGENNEMYNKKLSFGNRPYSLSSIIIQLDCLFLKITASIHSDLGTLSYNIPFDDYATKNAINRVIMTDDHWKPIMMANQEKDRLERINKKEVV